MTSVCNSHLHIHLHVHLHVRLHLHFASVLTCQLSQPLTWTEGSHPISIQLCTLNEFFLTFAIDYSHRPSSREQLGVWHWMCTRQSRYRLGNGTYKNQSTPAFEVQSASPWLWNPPSSDPTQPKVVIGDELLKALSTLVLVFGLNQRWMELAQDPTVGTEPPLIAPN